MAKVGLMLYTVRDDCARDLAGTLRAVAGLGYEGVELFDLHGHEPEVVRGWLDDLGLPVAGRHASLDALENGLPELAAELRVLGCDRLALSWIDPPSTREEAVATVERIAAVARRVCEAGLRFGFHNHWGELAPLGGGGTFLDLLLEQPAELVWLELDLGWAWEAGTDPAALLDHARGRSPLVHVKDFRRRGTATHCPVGDGEVGYDRVLPAAVAAGVEWLLVEQDETDGPALAAVERSLAFVRRALA
jgi:sugar phosphate isomerase/epimerase